MVCAVEAVATLVVGKSLQEIVSDFRGFYRLLTSDGQMRWVRAPTPASDAAALFYLFQKQPSGCRITSSWLVVMKLLICWIHYQDSKIRATSTLFG